MICEQFYQFFQRIIFRLTDSHDPSFFYALHLAEDDFQILKSEQGNPRSGLQSDQLLYIYFRSCSVSSKVCCTKSGHSGGLNQQILCRLKGSPRTIYHGIHILVVHEFDCFNRSSCGRPFFPRYGSSARREMHRRGRELQS